ncbi:protein kinase [Streptomyces sp. NPDC091292]|uniref:protein kinase n=1 Tax=Streptomyces sp. NPDC091292 TaxID=3365991 RepID=UPI003806B0B8
MDDYAGRVLADRYRLPLPPSDAYEPSYTRAFDTYSGQEVHVRQVPLPEIVEAEVLDADGLPEGFVRRDGVPPGGGAGRRGPDAAARSADPAVRRAIEAAQAAAQIPDHPRLDQVFDVFAEGGSLWIVSELVPARPLSALLADEPLTPYRAAEIAADVLTALRALHAHGWVHRNITIRTVLVCDDGRVMLTGLAAGAAEEALCGYDPRPEPEYGTEYGPGIDPGFGPGRGGGGAAGPGYSQVNGPPVPGGSLPPARGSGSGAGAGGGFGGGTGAGHGGGFGGGPGGGALTPRLPSAETDARAARAGAIAAYRAGARAAARVNEEQRGGGSPELPAGLTPASAPEPDGADPHGRITDPYGVRRPPGTWHGALPRGGSAAALPPGSTAPGAARGNEIAPVPGPAPAPVPGGPVPESPAWDVPHPRRGPATALAAERARHARMAVVGPVTERWAPEQAGPVHDNWQLAAPIGPATDLWALGALLFRAVQGHAPYPEDSTTELVQLVCAEPPAFAEECGPLRPVVESLLRQDPTERPDFEELRGWLRSLVRSAPEPEAGADVIAAPPADPRRLPILRRRGELVRRRRRSRQSTTTGPHGRHKRAGARGGEGARRGGDRTAPAKLGRTLLVLILLGLVAAVAYAVVFMPKADTAGGDSGAAQRTGATGSVSPTPDRSSASPAGDAGGGTGGDAKPSKSPGSQQPQTTGPDLPRGFTLRKDREGFQVAVASGWDRAPRNERGQIVYSDGDFQLIVVPGRDTTKEYGSDPMTYQRERESELQPFRDSTWATSSGMRRIDVGGRAMAEGQFTWQDTDGRTTYVRNLAMIVGGRYHVLQVRGPDAERDEVTRLYEQASATYEPTG